MILILDDDKAITEAMGEYLEMSDDPSLSAYVKVTSPKAAIHVIKNNKFDLLITDIMMPQMNGLELIKKIIKHYPATKIVCVSGYSDMMMSEINDLKINFLEKPFTHESFINMVNKAMNS